MAIDLESFRNTLRLTEPEYAAICAAAERANLGVTQWAHDALVASTRRMTNNPNL